MKITKRTKFLSNSTKDEKYILHEYSAAVLDTFLVVLQTLKFPTAKVDGYKQLKSRGERMELTITQPDDWHLHLRDGDLLKAVVPHRLS